MRILISDYSGHPFQVQLARSLATRGHTVHHVYSASFQTPKADLVVRADDPEGLSIVPVALGTPFAKDRFVARRRQEAVIGGLVAREIRAFRPAVVISGNAPLDTQSHILRAARAVGAGFVFWLQDIYSEAIRRVVPRRLPGIGHAVWAYYRRLEHKLLAGSDHVVAIADDFLPFLEQAGVPAERATVIENWAPLARMTPLPRDNDWAAATMAGSGLRLVYSGTLGYKHDPQVLLDLARSTTHSVYVFSEGKAADTLRAAVAVQSISNLTVHPWVPFADLPAMLSGADVFLAMIEGEAGHYSVPSKVLSYMCIGRPIVAAIPRTNLAARLIEREAAGGVVEPGDGAGLLALTSRFLEDADLRARCGRNARAYAERTFDIETITDRFEAVIGKAAPA